MHISRPAPVIRYTLMAALVLATRAACSADIVDFSPDARRIAYRWNHGLAVANVDASGASGNAEIAATDRAQYVRWSPTGRHFAVLNGTDAGMDLSIVNSSTNRPRGVGGGFRPPFAWREDGNRFACLRQTDAGTTELVWYNVAENGVSFRVAVPMAIAPDAPMVWLPATDDLAFIAADQNVYTVESGEFKRVTTSADTIGLSLYSGGKRLVWARRGPNLHYILMSVYAYDLTARNVVRLNFPERVSALNPDPRTAPESVDRVLFSPDGAHLLLFASLANPKGRSTALYVLGMDGKTARELQRVPAGSESTIHAAWSADGRSIGVLVTAANTGKLFVTAADGTAGRILRSEASR